MKLIVRSYNLEGLAAYLSARPPAYRTHPRMFDTECLHTPYLPPPTNTNTSAGHRSPALKPHRHTVPEADLLNLDNPSNPKPERRKTGFSKTPGGRSRQPSNGGGGGEETDDDEHDEEWVPDVFLFEYGTVVIWGMTEREEKRFLGSL
jgi:uncharacterized Rmd1/YagE family protein